MRRFSPFLLFGCLWLPVGLSAQVKDLTAESLPEFLARYEENLGPLERLFAELANEDLALRDEMGRPLGRRPLDDRRQALTDLRATLRELAANPQDLVLTVRFYVQGETLTDDLFDLSLIAYDNDREELGKHFSDYEVTMDRNQDRLESYVLSLAADKQKRLGELEKEIRELQQELKQAVKRPKAEPSRRP